MQQPEFRSCPEASVTPVAEGSAAARRGDVGMDADAAARASLPGLSADVALRDWDDLLCAVKARLRNIVGAVPAATPDAHAARLPAQVRAGVLDCVEALDQLHSTLTLELARSHQLELQVSDARTALAKLRAESAGMPGGHRQPLLRNGDRLPSQSHGSILRTRAEQARARLHVPARSVLCIDLDGFDPITQVHGPDAADELMMIISARLTRAVRAEDTVSWLRTGRFSCRLVHLSSREQLSRLACKLFDAVAAPVRSAMPGSACAPASELRSAAPGMKARRPC